MLGSINLGPEIEGLSDRVLRMSYVTVAPGGGLTAHSHDGRPGDVLVMKTGITHALSNHTADPAIFISTPIAKK